MPESILDILITTLKDVELADSGQDLDLFNENREQDIQNYVASLLKEGVPIPNIEYNDALIDEWSGGKAVALYDMETKRIIFDESTPIHDKRFQNFVAHEVLHYVDDISLPDIEDQILSRTDKASELIDPKIRKDITRYGLGERLEGDLPLYRTPDWAWDYSKTVSNPAEHLAYYTEEERGIVPEMTAEGAALRSLDEWQPLVEHETILPSKWLWSEPDTMRSWTGGMEPQYNILDISKYTQDRGAILDVFDELADNYLSEIGKKAYYQRK